jgi:glutathione peroxidase
MLKFSIAMIVLAGMAGVCRAGEGESGSADDVPPVLRFTMNRIDGTPKALADYKGRVLLIVNTASKCGFTKQYAGLQKLHERFAGRGLSVLGFPANDFGNQEPGTDGQIAEFCTGRFGVTFDMFAKVAVTGENACELYKFLTGAESNADSPGPVKWNFEKFLVGRDGKIVARFGSRVEPESEELVRAIESALGG